MLSSLKVLAPRRPRSAASFRVNAVMPFGVWGVLVFGCVLDGGVCLMGARFLQYGW